MNNVFFVSSTTITLVFLPGFIKIFHKNSYELRAFEGMELIVKNIKQKHLPSY
jgi:hypothetical protein